MRDAVSAKIYTGQFAVLAFISAVCFKSVMLPQYLAATAGRNAWLVMLTMAIADGAALACVYAVTTRTDLRALPAPVPLKALMLMIVGASCFAKLVLFTGETTAYCSTTLFDEGLWRLILAGLIPALIYLTLKGGNVLARTAQVAIWFVAAVVVLNVVFAENAGTLRNVLPVSYDEKVLFSCDKYLAWFGDFSPLMFFSVKGRKKKNFVPVLISYVFILAFTVGLSLAFTSVYGGGGVLVANAFNKLAIFNKLSTLLGTVDFTVVCAWLTIALVKLALLSVAVVESLYCLLGNRKALSAIVCLILAVVTFFGLGNQQTIYNVMTGGVRYLSVAADYVVPAVALVCTFTFGKKRCGKAEALYEETA